MKHLLHVQAIYPYNPNRTDPSWLQFQVGYGAQYHKRPDPFSALAYDQNLIATFARDRAASHLAEQIGVKTFVPVIAISSDHALTSIPIPWVFRLPEGTSLDQALPIITAAEHQSGANRSKLCEVLSSPSPIAEVRFQSTGEPR